MVKKDNINKMTLEEFFTKAPKHSYILNGNDDIFVYKTAKNKYFNYSVVIASEMYVIVNIQNTYVCMAPENISK